MKREGRQHGMVRCTWIMPPPFNLRPESRYVNRFESPPTAGIFTRVSSKPTNHSKYTGKCGRPKCRNCHEGPAHKSKEKTKGTLKVWSRSVTWRSVDDTPGTKLFGFSGTKMLDQMDEGIYEEDDCVDEVCDKSCGVALVAVDCESNDDDEENDEMSLCDLEFLGDDLVDDEDDGSWCLVEEIQEV